MILFRVLFIVLLISSFGSAQTLQINEVMSLNVSVLEDEDGDFPDWIELFNDSETSGQLAGYGLSDDPEDPLKWILPEVSIAGSGFLTIFASDKNRNLTGTELHTNFKIKSQGESLYLSNPEGRIIDGLRIPPMAANIAYGRSPDGSENWAYFLEPTPGLSNVADPAAEVAPGVQFLIPGGFYTGEIQVSLSASGENVQIRYTTNGGNPGQYSRKYNTPIQIRETTVLKARVFGPGLLPGPVTTHTFFINESTQLPVVSLSTHPDNLFDDDIGIYVEGNGSALGGYESSPIGPPANYWEDWERPVHVELFEPDAGPGFSVEAGIKMSGKTTRTLPQKSFAIFLRDKYGTDHLDYALFPDYPVLTFRSFLLRNAGSDNVINEGGVHFRDGLSAWLVQDLDLDFQMYRPCLLYLNGEFWGIYSIREKLNEDYLASHHGIDPRNVDILDDYHTLYPLVIEGDAEDYNDLLDYLQTHDLSDPAYAAYVETRLDVTNFLTYMAVQIFFANQDGPGHNCKFWRERTPDSRYRWLLYDTDHSFGQRLFVPNFHYAPDAYEDNTIAYYREEDGPGWPNPPESTFLFRKILENSGFQEHFVIILTDLMNSVFREEKTIQHFETIRRSLEPEIDKQLERWPVFGDDWWDNTDVIEDFLSYRHEILREHVIDEFNLNGSVEVTIRMEPAEAGQIQLNSLLIQDTDWSGILFENITLTLKALPNIGYRFIEWQGLSRTGETVSVKPEKNTTITAKFEREMVEAALVINEINYNSPAGFDTEDWIEIFNPLEKELDISEWVLIDDDSNDPFEFRSGTVVDALDYIVVCRNSETFSALWPDVETVVGDLPFGFDGNGDSIYLMTGGGEMLDSLTYSNQDPWPWQPNGEGATLALRNPNWDNSLGENWMASIGNGTPGSVNSLIGSVSDKKQPHRFRMLPAYPNPFNGKTTLEFELDKPSGLEVKIFDIRGRLIKVVHDDLSQAGFVQLTWDGKNEHNQVAASGVYLVITAAGKERFIQKVTLLQ